MIQKLSLVELNSMLHVINDASGAYKGIIPDDRWKDPYMSAVELKEEIKSGVQFYGWIEGELLLGVMGIQPIDNVTLIRHAYVLSDHQRRGIGEKLLAYLMSLTQTSEILVGTWEAASWAIRFYQKHGFALVSREESERLLCKYWSIPKRQIETSVVLEFRKEDSLHA
jgi:GNAT superfamily N-acetyltransferase